jgi:hypothetical protein
MGNWARLTMAVVPGMRCCMRSFALLAFLATAFSFAGPPKSPEVDRITIAQLEQMVAATPAKADADLAQQLAGVELTERLSSAHWTRWSSALPGDKSREALLLLADKSAFLSPPAEETPSDATPDATATRQMLVKLVNYVNTTLRQLPNLIASRQTTGFEDRPQEDALGPTGIVSYSYQPLHIVGKTQASITFRDRKELVEDSKPSMQGSKIGGLATTGEFGPILSTVLGDALKGKITWARWEQDAAHKLAVFHFEVPEVKSNYRVQFCCIVDSYDSSGQPELKPFDEQTSYHGEIAFDPSDGTIFRMMLESDLPAHELVANAGLIVEYASVDIGGKSFTCPAKSISILAAHVYQPHGMYSQANYTGPSKTFLNDAVFGNYRRFGSESHILTGENQLPPN